MTFPHENAPQIARQKADRRRFLATAPLALLAGCSLWQVPADDDAPKDQRAFSRVLSDERIILEVFFVHVPLTNQSFVDAIWKEVDEQQLPADARQRLASHGFRMGVIGGPLPTGIDELIKTSGTTASADQAQADSAEATPLVSRQELRLRPSKRGEIIPSPVREILNVMTVQNGELVGKTYESAQGRLGVQCNPRGDGRVDVEITPELHHGQSRRRAVGGDGVLRLETGQARLTFEALHSTCTLRTGQTILVGCRENPLKSVGRDFFVDATSAKPIQKLLVLRLVESPFDDTVSTL